MFTKVLGVVAIVVGATGAVYLTLRSKDGQLADAKKVANACNTIASKLTSYGDSAFAKSKPANT